MRELHLVRTPAPLAATVCSPLVAVPRARQEVIRLCAPPPEPELVDADDDIIDVEPPEPPPSFSAKLMAGVTEPLGFFDPAGFSEGASEGRLKFYREVELKHGRVAMLAAFGFPIAEVGLLHLHTHTHTHTNTHTHVSLCARCFLLRRFVLHACCSNFILCLAAR